MSNGSKYCLIVDNSNLARSKMRQIAKQSCPHLQVVTASSVAEAMRHVRSQNVAIMFLENDLPDGQGADMAQRLDQSESLTRFPVILFKDNPTPFMFAKAESAKNVREIWEKGDFTQPSVQRAVAKHVACH
ncbi:MAG: response regulator [Pelagimonas sp.]|jgi:DNA-binding NarL/FixJ family response regulator|nr:response regulator [Pelagimonas sp.]